MSGNEEEKSLGALNEVLSDICKSQRKTIKTILRAFIVTVVSFCIIICCMVAGFFWYESQFETVTTTTEEIELYTEGDGANANYINGNQYNDSSTHNEGVDE